MAVYNMPSEMQQPILSTCGSCGTASSCEQLCLSCTSPVCNMCMPSGEPCCLLCHFQYDQQMQNVVQEHMQSDYLFQDEEDFQSAYKIQIEETCGNCATTSMCATRCHSCSSIVCNLCMAHREGCCLECLGTFPESPRMTTSTCMPCPSGESLIAWLTALANTKQASLAHLPTKQRIDINDCLAPNAYQASAISCSGPTQMKHAFGSDTDSTALSWADLSESEGSVASPEPATTMMICNIPCRFGQTDVVDAIHSVGFAGAYDFVYLPRRSGKHNANIGYAFVEFRSAQNAERFADAFEDFQFAGTTSSKKCTVKHAHQQGFNSAPSRRPKRA